MNFWSNWIGKCALRAKRLIMWLLSVRASIYLVFVFKLFFLLESYRKSHDDVINWKNVPCYWSFVRGIHRSPVNSPHKGQWRGALMFSLICAWINGWVNNGEACHFRHHGAHYDVIVMIMVKCFFSQQNDVAFCDVGFRQSDFVLLSFQIKQLIHEHGWNMCDVEMIL